MRFFWFVFRTLLVRSISSKVDWKRKSPGLPWCVDVEMERLMWRSFCTLRISCMLDLSHSSRSNCLNSSLLMKWALIIWLIFRALCSSISYRMRFLEQGVRLAFPEALELALVWNFCWDYFRSSWSLALPIWQVYCTFAHVIPALPLAESIEP